MLMMTSFRLQICILLTFSALAVVSSAFDLAIIHTNDIHARFEQFNKFGSTCSEKNAAEGACFGGVARRMTKIKEIKANNKNTILLDAGDQFQGTQWFYHYRGYAASHFMQLLGYDVMTIGNHEFDRGIKGLRDFLENVTFPVVSCNINVDSEPTLTGLFNKSVVINVGGEKIGIVGYTFHGTPDLSSTGKVKFMDEIEAVRSEVNKLQHKGINKIIGLGHSGYNIDQRIAKHVTGIDVIVGGHTDTFLYTGDPPATEEPVGPYPTVVHPDGSPRDRVLVVQDYTWGKYLGLLRITFDDEGKITKFDGNPIVLDANVEEDEEILAEVKKYAAPIEESIGETIGESYVLLDGRRASCRTNECNLGNVVTDAMLEDQVTYKGEERWSDVSIAITNAGAIRAAIPPGDVSIGDVYAVLPFLNTNDIIELQGKYILEILEKSVAEYDPIELPGSFLQVSGLIVRCDLSKPPWSRIISVEVRCSACSVPDYEPLDLEKMYKLIVPTYLTNGGDGYNVISDNMSNYTSGNLDADSLIRYLNKHSPILQGIERRIYVKHASSGSTKQRPYLFLVVTLTLFFLLRGVISK